MGSRAQTDESGRWDWFREGYYAALNDSDSQLDNVDSLDFALAAFRRSKAVTGAASESVVETEHFRCP